MDQYNEDIAEYEAVYARFVAENYSDVNFPITTDYFEERWEEMSKEERAALTERALKKRKPNEEFEAYKRDR